MGNLQLFIFVGGLFLPASPRGGPQCDRRNGECGSGLTSYLCRGCSEGIVSGTCPDKYHKDCSFCTIADNGSTDYLFQHLPNLPGQPVVRDGLSVASVFNVDNTCGWEFGCSYSEAGSGRPFIVGMSPAKDYFDIDTAGVGQHQAEIHCYFLHPYLHTVDSDSVQAIKIVNIEVACGDHLSPELVQTTGIDQVPLKRISEDEYSVSLFVEDSNVDPGYYTLELRPTSKYSECTPNIQDVRMMATRPDPLDTSFPTINGLLVEQVGGSYSPYRLKIPTNFEAIQPVYVVVFDAETRWPERAISILNLEIKCGKEEIYEAPHISFRQILVTEIGIHRTRMNFGYRSNQIGCPIDSYEFFEDEARNNRAFNHYQWVNLDSSGLVDIIAPDVSQAKYFYIRMTTKGGVQGLGWIKVVVCGLEQIVPKTWKIVGKVGDPMLELYRYNLLPLAFKNLNPQESDVFCLLEKPKVGFTCSEPFSPSRVIMMAGYTMKVYFNLPIRKTRLQLCSSGYVSEFDFEICGLEQVTVLPTPSFRLKRTFQQGSKPQTISSRIIQRHLASDSENCLVAKFKLFERKGGAYVPFTRNWIDVDAKGSVSVQTKREGNFTVYLGGATETSAFAYLPISITVESPASNPALAEIADALVPKITASAEDVVKIESASSSTSDFIEVPISAYIGSTADLKAIQVEVASQGSQLVRYVQERQVLQISQAATKEAALENCSISISSVAADGKVQETELTLNFEIDKVAATQDPEDPVPILPTSDLDLQFEVDQESEEANQIYPEFIAEVDSFGMLLAQFTIPLEPRAVERLTPESLELQIVESEANVRVSNWTCEEFTSEQFKIQLQFTDFAAVSYAKPDFLRLLVTDFTFFQRRSRSLSSLYVRPGYQLDLQLPKQKDPSPAAKALAQTMGAAVDQAKGAVAVSTAINVLTSQSLSQIWSLVNILQILVHVPLVRDLRFPANVEDFYAALLPIATFDLLPSEYSTDLAFEFSEDAELDEDRYSEYTLLDYESHSAIPNLGSIFWFSVYVMLLWAGLLVIIGLRGVRVGPFNKKRQKLCKNKAMSTTITFLLESCLEWMIAIYLNVKSPSFATVGDALSFFIVIIFGLASSVGIPVFLWMRLIAIPAEKVDQLQFRAAEESIGPAYEGISTGTRWSRAFNFVFVVRRIALMIAFVAFRDLVGLQVQLLVILSMLQVVYLLTSKPMAERQAQRMEVYNEFTILLVMASLPAFTDFVPEPSTQFQFGWITLFVMVSNILVNVGLALKSTLNSTVSSLRQRCLTRPNNPPRASRVYIETVPTSSMKRAKSTRKKTGDFDDVICGEAVDLEPKPVFKKRVNSVAPVQIIVEESKESDSEKPTSFRKENVVLDTTEPVESQSVIESHLDISKQQEEEEKTEFGSQESISENESSCSNTSDGSHDSGDDESEESEGSDASYDSENSEGESQDERTSHIDESSNSPSKPPAEPRPNSIISPTHESSSKPAEMKSESKVEEFEDDWDVGSASGTDAVAGAAPQDKNALPTTSKPEEAPGLKNQIQSEDQNALSKESEDVASSSEASEEGESDEPDSVSRKTSNIKSVEEAKRDEQASRSPEGANPADMADIEDKLEEALAEFERWKASKDLQEESDSIFHQI